MMQEEGILKDPSDPPKADDESKSVQFETHHHAAEALPSSPPTRSHSRPTMTRARSQHIDIATGLATTRDTRVEVVDEDEAKEGPKAKWRKLLCWWRPANAVEEENAKRRSSLTSSSDNKPQYRITSFAEENKAFLSRRMETHVGNILADYLRWTFHSSFTEIFLSAFIGYMWLIVIFALFIWWIARRDPDCVYNYEERKNFVDAFQLSWTTLSTVGYGLIGPNLQRSCVGINMLCAYESFVGVLYGAFAGAVIFGKIARIQSIAQVIFSDPICVRYGEGVVETAAVEEEECEEDPECDEPDYPCPLLEFRIVNELWNKRGGEIMNATVNVVASTEVAEHDEAESIQQAKSTKKRSIIANTLRMQSSGNDKHGSSGELGQHSESHLSKGASLLGAKMAKKDGNMFQKMNHTLLHLGGTSHDFNDVEQEEGDPFHAQTKKEVERTFAKRLAERLAHMQKAGGLSVMDAVQSSVTVEEDCDNKLVPRRRFHKLHIETDSHPFFKRKWIIQHRLDETSPLLSHKARRMIMANGGKWPPALCNHDKVRKHINFHEIIVNFSGTSNDSGSTVFSQKVYDYVDMNVGYSFAPVLDVTYEEGMLVDPNLVNDVTEQAGGGGEPLTHVDGNIVVGTEEDMLAMTLRDDGIPLMEETIANIEGYDATSMQDAEVAPSS